MFIGIDIEDNKRFLNWSDEKLGRVFFSDEILYAKKYKDYLMHLTAIWCCKEAVIKAFKSKDLVYTDVFVSHLDNVPLIDLLDEKNIKLYNLAKNLGVGRIEVSLSHEKDKSVAVAISF